MKLQRTFAVSRKELIHILRDPWSLGMAVAIPALMLVLFGYALTLDVDNVPMIVWDQSNTPASRELTSRFSGSRYFSVKVYADDYRQVEQAIDSREVLAALVISREFAGDQAAGRETSVQLIVNGSDPNTATIAMGYADAIFSTYNQSLIVQRMERRGVQDYRPPMEFRPRVWFNTELESKNFIIPGLIAVIMSIIAALLTSLTIAGEWERGTMEQLISTPIRRHELILGKLLPYWGIGIFDVVLAVIMGELLFDVPLRGSVLLLFGMAGIFLIGVLSMGILISAATRSQLVASQMAILATFVPSYLLSGFMFAISNMPAPIQAVTYAVPARYFITLLKGIYLKGVGLEVLWVQAVLLVVFSFAMFLLASRKFRKKL